jgi:PadR family transcriptional regulator PadR
MGGGKSEVLQGTLDLMVLKTLESMGTLHGYGIARRIEQVSNDTLNLNQGTIYPALLRLQQRGWITAEWGTSEKKRRAKYYSLSRLGKKQVEKETENWQRIAATMEYFSRRRVKEPVYGLAANLAKSLRCILHREEAQSRA